MKVTKAAPKAKRPATSGLAHGYGHDLRIFAECPLLPNLQGMEDELGEFLLSLVSQWLLDYAWDLCTQHVKPAAVEVCLDSHGGMP